MVCEVWLTLEKFTMNDEWTIVDVSRTREDAMEVCRAYDSATDTDIEYRVVSLAAWEIEQKKLVVG